MFRRGTTVKEKNPSESREYGDIHEERTVSEQRDPYGSNVQRETPVAAPPRGDGQAVRVEERMVGREEMMQPAPISLGRYLANWYTLLAGSALVFFETVLALRLFFKLTTADNTNGFVKLIYHFSGQVIRPFTGVIPDQTIVKGGILEPSVIIAMVLFAVGALLTIWIVRSLATLRSWGNKLIPM